jgi:2-polyprenyl-3-methyl-5-hydroxy-6-metoxy-1,4-benzoquinol methylase
MSTAPQGSTYVLGHADAEVQRLLLQGRLYDHYTEHALRLAGLRPGMRVLDIGSGPGDVSFVAARLVGPTGAVLGVDAAPAMVELARARADEKSLPTVRFILDAVDEVSLDEPVDAVIGRLILMHLPDPAATLRRLSSFVRPGGIVAFSENDITATHTTPDIPLFGQVVAAIVRAFEAMGLSAAFGTTLHSVFADAGLGAPHLIQGAPTGTAADTDVLAYAAEVWRLVSPVAEQRGFSVDTDIDTFVAQFRQLVLEADALITMAPMITAWAQVPK